LYVQTSAHWVQGSWEWQAFNISHTFTLLFNLGQPITWLPTETRETNRLLWWTICTPHSKLL